MLNLVVLLVVCVVEIFPEVHKTTETKIKL